MTPHREFQSLITADRQNRDNFKTLLSAVVPRPIAFVSTISANGVPNLAPFSFFNAVGSNPPALIFSPCTKADGSSKDTLLNLQEVPECVVHTASHSIRMEMNQTSFPYPPQVDELQRAGFTSMPSRFVRPPRVAESPVHMECRLIQIVPVGHGPLSANLCICEILCFHVASDHLLPDGTVDASRIDAIARLGGDDYCTIRDRFALAKPASP